MYFRSSSPARSLRYRSQCCLNCGTKLDKSDRYCHYCGQLNSTKRLSLYNYFSEFLTSVITYDSRIIYTIKDLTTKPGTISRNYIKGKRIRYANPFRFYLSVSIIFFLISGFTDLITEETNDFRIENGTSPETNSFSTIIDSLFIQNSKNAKASYNYIAEEELNKLPFSERQIKKVGLYRSFYRTTDIQSAHQALDSLKYDHSRYNLWLYNRNKALDHINENPSDFLAYMISKTPFVLFFLAPFLAFIFLLLYFRWYPYKVIKQNLLRRQEKLWYYRQNNPRLSTIMIYLHALLRWPFRVKRKINYMEHLVFIFHIFTFVFLGLLFCLFPDILFSTGLFKNIFLVVAPFYIYKALRNFYRQNRFLTMINFLIINIVFLVLGGISAAFFFIITAVTY